MRPAELWRHSSIRLALGVSLLVLTTLILAGGIFYGLMRAQLSSRQDASLAEIFAAIRQTSLQGDETDLLEAIDARIQASPDRSTLYLLRDKAGKVLASNVGSVALPEGWSVRPAGSLGILNDRFYRVYAGPAGDYSLAIGLSDADIDALRDIFLRALGWSALFAVLAAIGMGTGLALRVQARIAEAEAVAGCVAQGDLSARLPVSTRGDDLDRISEAVNTALARLEEQVAAMQQISADIAHDLRTPLNRLRIHIEDAARKGAAGGDVTEDLERAIKQSEAMDQTFSALLRIAQIESGSRRERFAPVDLAALMENVAEVYSEVAEDAGQSLRMQTTGPAWITGDRELLTQAFANLIENAIRHTPSKVTITCSVEITARHVTAAIADNGPGIPAAQRASVVRRFYRLDKSRASEGTGLGLALVKAVTELHGADLTLSDDLPGLRVGMTFARLERVRRRDGAHGASGRPDTPGGGSPGLEAGRPPGG